MPLIKERPRISLRVPRSIEPGQPFTAEVVLESTKGVDVEWVDVVLEGTEGWRYSSGDNSYSETHRICRLGSRVAGDTTLEPGRTELQVRSELPAAAPASHKGRTAYVRYVMSVHASIDWWPDAKASFEIFVRRPGDAPATVSGNPRVYATSPQGPKGTAPHVELSLASDVVAVGGEIEGSVAFHNVSHNAYRGVNLTLVGRERRRDSTGRDRGYSDTRLEHRLPFHPSTEGEAKRFRLRIPSTMSATQEASLWRLEWFLEVTSQIKWRGNPSFMVPIRVMPSGTAVSMERFDAPPMVGSERVAEVWQAVASRHGASFDGERMTARIADVEVEIRQDHRGDAGIFLEAEIRFPGIGLHLDAGPRGGFLRFVGGGVDLGDSAFAKKHYANGREKAQVEAFVRGLMPLFRDLELEDAHDGALNVSREGAGHSGQTLDPFVNDVLILARGIAPARDRIPPPAAMKEAEASWTRLASRLGGRLEKGAMAVQGNLDGTPSAVVTEWSEDGDPLRTRLAITADPPIDDASCFVHDGSGVAEGDEGKLPGDARLLIDAMAGAGFRELRVTPNELELSLDAPQLDAAPLLDLLRKLASLATLLRANEGPYR